MKKKVYGISVSYKSNSDLSAVAFTEQISGFALLYDVRRNKKALARTSMFWLSIEQAKTILSPIELRLLNIISNSCPVAVEYERNETSFYYDYKDRIMRGKRTIKIDSAELMKVAEVFHDWISYIPDLHYNSITDIRHTGFYKDENLKLEFTANELQEKILNRQFKIPAEHRAPGIDSIFTEQIGFHYYSAISIHRNFVELKYLASENDYPLVGDAKVFYLPLSVFQKELPEWVYFLVERYL